MSALGPASESVVVPHDVTSVALVRRSMDRTLQQSGVAGNARDDALIVLSELVSNAVKHASPLGGSGIGVRWTVEAEELEIAVTDGGSHTDPVADIAAMTAVGGRGLDIVRKLSRGWGVSESEGRVTVWATLALPSAERTPPAAGDPAAVGDLAAAGNSAAAGDLAAAQPGEAPGAPRVLDLEAGDRARSGPAAAPLEPEHPMPRGATPDH